MPSINQERISDPVLRNFGLAYMQTLPVRAHDMLFPTMDTSEVGETGKYYIHDANTYFRRYDTLRADGAEAAAGRFKLTSGAFTQNEWAFKSDLTDRQKKNAINPLKIEQGRTSFATRVVEIDREIQARNKVFPVVSGTPFTPEKTVSPLWNAGSSKVMTDVIVAKQSFIKLNGVEPNLLLIPPRVWAIFMDATVTDTVGWILHERLKYVMATTGRNINPDLVAQLFDFNGTVIVPNMVYTDAIDSNAVVGGAGITSGAFVWDVYSDDSTAATSMIFAYVDPSADEMSLTMGWCFQNEPYDVKRWREENLDKEWFQARRVEERYIVAASCLYRMKVM